MEPKWVPSLRLPHTVPCRGDGAEMGAACIGRAVGNGSRDEIWVSDDKPVTCSNLILDADGMPTTLVYPNEQEWTAETTQALGIDPDVFDGFDGNLYLVWGSHMPGGAQVVLLGDDGFISPNTVGKTSVTSDSGEVAEAYKIVATCYSDPNGADFPEGRTGEAPAVLPKECGGTQYYYLFWTWGACCNGLASTYETVMGRSTSPFGPYVDKNGMDMAVLDSTTQNPGGSYFLRSALNVSASDKSAIGSRYIGPGHVAFFEYTDAVGEPVMIVTFHFYDAAQQGTALLGARRVFFDSSCWPYVDGQTWGVNELFNLASTSAPPTSRETTKVSETVEPSSTSSVPPSYSSAAAFLSAQSFFLYLSSSWWL
ncbi:abn-ts [Symbiodinium sp. CCMP2592]|nr:abn-ts [Symbiodinium sp. CCMP2592]